ncbi:MAG TPA: hypothetical protein VMH81_15805 [Bryobacteraceae bacterium]|nr:hypothetical protein [Bryobacteraceae bacterium]
MKIFATIGLVLAVSDLCAFADTAVRTGEQAVLSAYKSMEEADRKGDGQLWLSLRGRKTVEGMNQALRDAIRKGGRTRPNVQYLPLAVRAVKDRAVILGKVSDPDAKTEQYEAVQFAIEDGAWKVTSEQWGEKPFDPFVMYALLEPEDGAFARAGSRWKLIPYASPNPDIVKKDEVIWGIQGTYDEASVYVRFESVVAIPAPGSKIKPEIGKAGRTGGPAPPPPILIKVSSPSLETPKEYSISVSALPATTETTDARGRTVTTYSANYELFVKNANGEQAYETTLSDGASGHMLSVHDRSIDVKIPIAAFGIDPAAPHTVDLDEADSLLRILPYHIEAFVPR